MLELATGQIEAAMKDSNASVDVLTDSFTTMAGYLQMMTDTFYDRLTQRLAHVSHSLAELNDLVGDKQRVLSPQEWIALRDKIRSKYTSVDECAMFDAVMSGMSVHEALEHYISDIKDKGNDIDLF